MKSLKILFCLSVAIALTGCSTWSMSSVKQTDAQKAMSLKETNPNNIIVTETDITDRAYTSLGEVNATVNKTTVFNKAPTKEGVNQSLKEKAAKLGADAVILVRYGDGGISAFSWGSLEGRGRAVKFKN